MYYSLLNSHTLMGKKLDLFHDYSLLILIFISIFVFGLLVVFWVNSWVFDNFIESKITEFLWTGFPGIVLFFLLLPSVHGLYNLDYIRLVRVKMNAVVSGRQWYWSFKFVPQSNKKTMCNDCRMYFSLADKFRFWFHDSLEPHNMFLPGMKEKIDSALDPKEYWISPLGIVQGFRLPPTLKKLRKDYDKYDYNHPVLSGTQYHIPVPKNLPNVPSEEISNLHRSNLFWGQYKMPIWGEFKYQVNSYLSQGSLGILRNLDSNVPLLIPARKLVRFFFWSSDVIHSFAVPELSVKLDCVPGRLNSAFVLVRHVGKYFGQCSEMCGANHSFMPVSMECFPWDHSFCFKKHFITDFDYYFNRVFFLRTTFLRLNLVWGYLLMKVTYYLGFGPNIGYSESMPSVLCPEGVWFVKVIYKWFTGENYFEPVPTTCKLGDVGPMG